MELEEDMQQDLSEGGFLKPKALVGSRQWAVSWLNCNCESALESRESGTSSEATGIGSTISVELITASEDVSGFHLHGSTWFRTPVATRGGNMRQLLFLCPFSDLNWNRPFSGGSIPPDSKEESQCGSTKSRQEQRGPPRWRSHRMAELEHLVRRQCKEAQCQIEEIMRVLAAAETAHSDSEVGEAPYVRPRMAEKEAQLAATTQGAAVTSFPSIKTNRYDGQGSWEAFQSAFEAIARVNQWSDAEKGGQLIAEEAQSCILTLPTGDRTNYTALAEQFGQAASSFTHVTRLKE
ncbi:UNVERIFIED_CONTAM: hypothetical protein FKN15_000822 [Acipenser sinensis]